MNLPPDRFDPKTNQFHIFREIIITQEEYELLKSRLKLSKFEQQLFDCCNETIGIIEMKWSYGESKGRNISYSMNSDQ